MNKKSMFTQTVQGANGRYVQMCNFSYIGQILLVLVMLAAVVCGELWICGYFGPTSLGAEVIVSLMVLAASGMTGLIVGILTMPTGENKKVTKSGRIFSTASIILGVLATIQFVWILSLILGHVLDLLFS